MPSARDEKRVSQTTSDQDLDLDRLVAGFVHVLRRGGLTVTIGQSTTFRAALGATGVSRGLDVYWAGRATLVTRRDHVGMYDAMFVAFFHQNSSGFTMRFDEILETMAEATDDGDGNESDGDETDETTVPVLRYSRADRLSEKDFAEFSAAEIREADAVMASLRLNPEWRRSRRRVLSSRGSRPDLRRTVREAMRRGGEPIKLASTAPGERRRRLVLLLDVSGSMEVYSRVMVRFAHSAVMGRGNVEVFTFGTRLTRITRQLRTHDIDQAIAAAASEVADWSGGTRLGDSIERFNQEWGVRGMARGATVVVLSDGWDRGEPATMERAMQRLSRVAHRVMWVNPLKAGDGYEPTARGMAAALPYIDDFLEGHCLRSLRQLSDAITAQ